jgi:hypothetical protein
MERIPIPRYYSASDSTQKLRRAANNQRKEKEVPRIFGLFRGVLHTHVPVDYPRVLLLGLQRFNVPGRIKVATTSATVRTKIGNTNNPKVSLVSTSFVKTKSH